MQEGRGEQERKGGMGKRGREGEGMGVRGGEGEGRGGRGEGEGNVSRSPVDRSEDNYTLDRGHTAFYPSQPEGGLRHSA